jgi:hypothetical protein
MNEGRFATDGSEWGVFFATDEHGFSRMNRSGARWCFGATDGSEWGGFFLPRMNTDFHG